MTACPVLLKDCAVSSLSEELNDPVAFQQLNVLFSVHSVWTLEELCPFVSNDSRPNHDGPGELFFFQKQVVSPLCPPHHRTVGGCRKPGLVGEEDVCPVEVLVGEAERQPHLDVSVRQKGSVVERLVRILQVVPDPVHSRLAGSEDVGENGVRNSSVVSRDRIDQPNELLVVPHRVDSFSTWHLERFFLGDGISHLPDKIGPAFESLLQINDGSSTLTVPRKEEVEWEDFL